MGKPTICIGENKDADHLRGNREFTAKLISAFVFATRIVQFLYFLRGWFRKFCHRCYNFVNIHDRLLYYTLIERATFLLYNDAKTIHEQNKYFEIHALKDTWGKTTGTFS